MLKLLSASSVLVLFLVMACGHSDPAGNPSAYQQGSSRCSQTFLDDHNDVAKKVNSADNLTTMRQARAKASAFKSMYAGVSCEAQSEKTKKSTTINVDSDYATIIKNLDARISLQELVEKR